MPNPIEAREFKIARRRAETICVKREEKLVRNRVDEAMGSLKGVSIPLSPTSVRPHATRARWFRCAVISDVLQILDRCRTLQPSCGIDLAH